MNPTGLAAPSQWRRAFDQGMLDLLRGRPRVAQAPAQALQALCLQANDMEHPAHPQRRMFWAVAGHFFTHLAQADALPWESWHGLVCARIMAAAPGLAPLAPTPTQQAEALNTLFLEIVHAQVQDWQGLLAQWSAVPLDAAAASALLAPTTKLQTLLHDMQLDGMAELCEALAQGLQAALTRDDLAGVADQAAQAAQEMLRLLHQYAAGFVRPPNPALLADLRSLCA